MPLTTESLKAADMLVAKESFVGQLPDGSDFRGVANVTRVRADHPAVKAWPGLFKELDASFPAVEAATAEPGKKRGG